MHSIINRLSIQIQKQVIVRIPNGIIQIHDKDRNPDRDLDCNPDRNQIHTKI